MNVKTFFAAVAIATISPLAALADNPETDHERGIYTVRVTEPGTFGLAFLQTVGGEGGSQTTDNDWLRVRNLTIIGTLNDADLAYFTRMANLESLDMGQVSGIKTITGCRGLKNLKWVNLATATTNVGKEAFRECTALQTINLTHVDSIFENAFYQCQAHRQTSLPSVKYIGNMSFYDNEALTTLEAPLCETLDGAAFYQCSSLESVNMPQLLNLGSDCFRHTILSSIVMSDNVTLIPSRAFEGTKFTRFPFPSKLKRVGTYAFINASLEEASLPEGTTHLEYCAFSGTPLRTVSLPSTIQFIDNNAMPDSYYYDNDQRKNVYYLTDVYNYSTNPYATKVFKDCAATATLHVPYMSIGNYKLSEAWYSFAHTVPLDIEMQHVLITDEFFLISPQGIAPKANLSVRPLVDYGDTRYSNSTFGHLTITQEQPFAIGHYTQVQDFTNRSRYTNYDDLGIRKYWNSYEHITTMVAKSEATAQGVTTECFIPKNEWMFLSFPYDVRVANIGVDPSVQWAIRSYSGENRASGNGDTWLNLASSDILQAGKGYILRCSVTEGDGAFFTFPAEDNGKKNTIFSTTNISVPLTEYAAEYPNNRSWNLVGNPFAAFFFIQNLDYNAPITIYSQNGYQAYTPWDDEYVLRPNEAFFVQKPIDCSEIIFEHAGAQHSQTPPAEVKHAPRHIAANSAQRSVYNFYLSNGTASDRARLALNPTAQPGYDLTRDAEKLMSADAAVQLYMVEDNLPLAINERPAQAEPYALGYTAQAAGRLTLQAERKNSTKDILLHDLLTGTTTNLARESYSFSTEAGTFDSRFTILIQDDATAIDLAAQPSQIDVQDGRLIIHSGAARVFNTAGSLVAQTTGGGSFRLAPGIYVVKTAAGAHTIVIQ